MLLVDLGFVHRASCPNVFHHVGGRTHCSVHGGDFASERPKFALDWFGISVAERYEITILPRLDPGPTDAKEGTCFNRVVLWRGGHTEHEVDLRTLKS